MRNPDRPQAPGYLANLMARLFHERSGDGLHPLGIRPEQFPLLAELWFGPGGTRASFVTSLEMDQADVDALVKSWAEDGLIESFPASIDAPLILTSKARLARDAAVAAARGANDIARTALTPDELAQMMALMNRVIDALQAARR
jgi:DNA-binding MarR family transcriptional regulator